MGKPLKKKHKKLKKTFDTVDESDVAIGGSRSKLQNLPVADADLDKQDIPRKTREIMHNRQAIGKKNLKQKSKQKQKQKLKKEAEQYGMTKPLKPVPRFVQGKFEKDRDFMRRVELEAHRAVKMAQMEDKYKVDFTEQKGQNSTNKPAVKQQTKLDKDDEGGRPMSNKHTRKLQRQNEPFERKLMKIKKKSSERKREKDKERKKKKVAASRMKKLDKAGDFSALKDDIAFGEVAMAPPTLSAKPRKASTEDSVPRPGKRSLLLTAIMEKAGNSSSTEPGDPQIHKPAVKSVTQRHLGQTMKRKFLSPVQQQITDFQRQKAIHLYREMRDKKYQQNNLKT